MTELEKGVEQKCSEIRLLDEEKKELATRSEKAEAERRELQKEMQASQALVEELKTAVQEKESSECLLQSGPSGGGTALKRGHRAD